MNAVRYTLLIVIAVPCLIILVWFFAIPDDYLQTSLENTIAEHSTSDIDITMTGFRKGLFFSTHADTLDVIMNKKPLLRVTDLKSSIHPLDSARRKRAFSVQGNIGNGSIQGVFNLPDSGTLTINKADLKAIPYLKSLGIVAEGLLSGEIIIKGDTADILFQIPHAELKETALGELLTLKTFQNIQGALMVKGNTVMIKSVSLEADKGYARLKGEISNGVMNMILEVMPEPGRLESFESMLLANYLVTPGYYVIPIEGPLL